MFKYNLVNSAPAVNEVDIKNVEEYIGCRFPNSLRELYLKFNGGEVDGKRKIFESPSGIELEVKTFLPIRKKRFEGDSLLEESYDIFVRNKKLIPVGFILFAMDSGGFRYCINCGTEEIYFNNLDHFERSGGPMQLIASSLSEFIDGMVTEEQAYGD
jgi:cell wall assembly regulator SMI1